MSGQLKKCENEKKKLNECKKQVQIEVQLWSQLMNTISWKPPEFFEESVKNWIHLVVSPADLLK